MVQSASNGTSVHALTVTTANAGMSAKPVPSKVSWESSTNPLPMIGQGPDKISLYSLERVPSLSSRSGSTSWLMEDYINAHRLVRQSGAYNFEGCRISVPTAIRYDRMREALGVRATAKETRVLNLLEFGMPVDCKAGFGVTKLQKNHFSALSFKDDVADYFSKGTKSKALLGPFKVSPIPDLCFSPLMTVPKESSLRRVIVDFSFPPGKAINDGIPKETYLDFVVKFSLPSVKTMVDRLNDLGVGCLMYKRDLKGAFRQFSLDPGDYKLTGLH